MGARKKVFPLEKNSYPRMRDGANLDNVPEGIFPQLLSILANEEEMFYGIFVILEEGTLGGVDGGKNPSQQRETLPIPQVPIRLTNVWCGRLDGIMDPLPF